MEKEIKAITSSKKIKKINENLIEIETLGFINSKTPIRIFVKKENNKTFLSDNKNTLKYMKDIYELNSKDVKQCISDVLKHYGFILQKGEIMVEICDEKTACKKYNDFLMCVGQLANMFIFFDNPL